MKIIFLQEVWFPLQQVMVLSSVLKKAGHKTAVAIGNWKKIYPELKKFQPDIIAFPVITPYRKFMMKTSSEIKKAGFKSLIIIGGYDASFFPQIIEKADIDALCIGEGEEAIVEFANALENKNDYSDIKNLWIKTENKLLLFLLEIMICLPKVTNLRVFC